MKGLYPQLCWGYRVSGKGEDIQKKPPMLKREWCRKPNSSKGGSPKIRGTLCNYKNVEIVAGAVCEDHVHLSVAIPPKISISSFMGYLKGKSTLMIYDRHPELQIKWNKAFWARGYYVETIGNITDAAVRKYINEKAEESRKEDMKGIAL